MSTATPFSSVKLPAALVDKARDAAQPMRRSVASQIEYWATLGRALEQAGLSTQDSQALIAREESAGYAVESTCSPPSPPNSMPCTAMCLPWRNPVRWRSAPRWRWPRTAPRRNPVRAAATRPDPAA